VANSGAVAEIVVHLVRVFPKRASGDETPNSRRFAAIEGATLGMASKSVMSSLLAGFMVGYPKVMGHFAKRISDSFAFRDIALIATSRFNAKL